MDAKKIAFASFLFLAIILQPAFCEQAGNSTLSVTFLSSDGTPLSGEMVTFSVDGSDVTAYTDAGGVATVEAAAGGEVRASVKKNEYDYSFSFNVSADGSPTSDTARLPQLLTIDSFEASPDGAGCYRLSAKASDPRTNKPISVRMAQVKNGAQGGAVQLSIDDSNAYVGRVCAEAGTVVVVTASNTYETAVKNITLTAPAPPPPPEPIQPVANFTNSTNATGQLVPPAPSGPGLSEVLGSVFVAIVVVAIVALAAIVALSRLNPGVAKYFARTYEILVGSAVRPINEYLRTVFRKKEPPPELPTFGQPPQGPMAPQV